MGIPVIGLIDKGLDLIKSWKDGKIKEEELEAAFAQLKETHKHDVIMAGADIIKAEAQGESWLQRNWRPLLMMDFGILITAHWFGYTAENLTPEVQLAVFNLLQIGIGGYVIGRSVEKAAPAIAAVVKGK